jgi:acyl-coenzyme A thioesterase PaaI-like protein
VTGGELVADAREESAAGRIGTSLVRVTDETGALVAIFKGSAYRRRDGEGGPPSA